MNFNAVRLVRRLLLISLGSRREAVYSSGKSGTLHTLAALPADVLRIVRGLLKDYLAGVEVAVGQTG
jgi:hypothetical protein